MRIRYGKAIKPVTSIKLWQNGGYSSKDNKICEITTYKTLSIYILGYYLNIDFNECKVKLND